MTDTPTSRSTARRRIPGRRARALRPGLLSVFAFTVVAALGVATALAPQPPASSQAEVAALALPAQTYAVSHDVTPQEVQLASYSAEPGFATFIAGGTNHDWAKLVLLYGGWPVTESSVTVITRWMRQENYIDSWWTRNNPLNNGWGSGGGGGLGSYPSLVVAAQNAAAALHGHPGYASIVAGFASSAPTEVIEAAIWASPWASGHYNNGAHWHYTPVPVVTAPRGAWG